MAPAVGTAEALCELGRLDEAEAAAAKAMERFPANPWPMIRHASVSMRRQNWEEALRRLQLVRARFAGEPTGHVYAGLALREMGRLDEAEEILDAAIKQFPLNPWPLVHYASDRKSVV